MDNSKVVFSVSDITYQIKILLEENFPTLWVKGEISNYKKHYSGHYYFTLKDPTAQISCVMWKSRTHSIPFELEDGMQVHIFGNLRLYEKSGRYQLDSILIQQAGIGELQLRFEELKKQLYEEGLFDDSNKMPLPELPERIGIITSPTGAAIKDILSVIRRRYPVCELVVRGVKVQGERAANEVADAIYKLNEIEDIDLIIMGRGGGSLEDLWAFNEEIVARAIFNSKIPIISAVGHDIDYTISDFVSDLRAPTPSAAAELAVPDINELQSRIVDIYKYLKTNIENYLSNSKNNINYYINSYAFKKPVDIVKQHSQRIDELIPQLKSQYKNQIFTKKNKVENLTSRLESLHPQHVLKRGYAIIQKNQEIVKSIDNVEINDKLDISLIDGKIKSTVREKKHD